MDIGRSLIGYPQDISLYGEWLTLQNILVLFFVSLITGCKRCVLRIVSSGYLGRAHIVVIRGCWLNLLILFLYVFITIVLSSIVIFCTALSLIGLVIFQCGFSLGSIVLRSCYVFSNDGVQLCSCDICIHDLYGISYLSIVSGGFFIKLSIWCETPMYIMNAKNWDLLIDRNNTYIWVLINVILSFCLHHNFLVYLIVIFLLLVHFTNGNFALFEG